MADDQSSRGRIRHYNYAERMARGDTYGLLLVLLLITYMVMALTTPSLWHRAIATALLGVVLLLALHTSHVRGRAFRIGVAVVTVAVATNIIQAAVGREGNDGSTYIIFVLVLIAPVVILNRILRHDVISLETILGAICVYVLLALAFAGIYAGINDAEPLGFFAQTMHPTNVDFLYFSFISITTTGYGDLTAATSTGRVMVTFEVLIGQIFLVTLVARLVGMLGVSRSRSRRDDDSGFEE